MSAYYSWINDLQELIDAINKQYDGKEKSLFKQRQRSIVPRTNWQTSKVTRHSFCKDNIYCESWVNKFPRSMNPKWFIIASKIIYHIHNGVLRTAYYISKRSVETGSFYIYHFFWNANQKVSRYWINLIKIIKQALFTLFSNLLLKYSILISRQVDKMTA